MHDACNTVLFFLQARFYEYQKLTKYYSQGPFCWLQQRNLEINVNVFIIKVRFRVCCSFSSPIPATGTHLFSCVHIPKNVFIAASVLKSLDLLRLVEMSLLYVYIIVIKNKMWFYWLFNRKRKKCITYYQPCSWQWSLLKN